MSFAETNISLNTTYTTLSESGDRSIVKVCTSNNINKWGINRTVPNLTTIAASFPRSATQSAINRMNAVKAAPYRLGDFRLYNHLEDAPGIKLPPPTNPFLGADSIRFNIRSFGNYTISRQEWTGSSWATILDNTDTYFRVVPVSPPFSNHALLINNTSGTVTGNNTVDAFVAHTLDVNLNLEVQDNLTTSSRRFRIVVNHPDSGDIDAFSNIIDLTQLSSVPSLNVSPSGLIYTQMNNTITPNPQTFEITFNPTGTHRVLIDKTDAGFGTGWYSHDLAVTTTTPTPITVTVNSLYTPPPGQFERIGYVRTRLERTSDRAIVDTKLVTIIQQVML